MEKKNIIKYPSYLFLKWLYVCVVQHHRSTLRSIFSLGFYSPFKIISYILNQAIQVDGMIALVMHYNQNVAFWDVPG